MKARKGHHDKEAQLLLEAGRGNALAFKELYTILRPIVRGFLAKHAGSDARGYLDDMTQETFVRAWQGASRYRGQASVKTFVISIAKNVLRKELSNRRRHRTILMGDVDHLPGTYASDAVPERPYGEPDEPVRELRQAMAGLTAPQRQAIELDFIRGLPRHEAVKLAGCTHNQFANRLYRAMKALERLLSNLPKSIVL